MIIEFEIHHRLVFPLSCDGDTQSALMGLMKNVISLTISNLLAIIWAALSNQGCKQEVLIEATQIGYA